MELPLGAAVGLAELYENPYPAYRRLREREPVSWIPSLGMWFATSYAPVRRILLDDVTFTSDWAASPIRDTFGSQMLSTDGSLHDRYRRATQAPFLASNVRSSIESAIRDAADELIRAWPAGRPVELRSQFASPLPIRIMLLVSGISLAAEPEIRRWYDCFERALANFSFEAAIREEAARNVAEFYAFLDEEIAAARGRDENQGLLGRLVLTGSATGLRDDEIRRNLAIILFGGISTVEALILNTIWALADAPDTLRRARADRQLLPRIVDETIRLTGPVQSATRCVTRNTEIGGMRLRKDDVVNCMLGAANHDPAIFPDPERFDIDRPNLSKHLGFATGSHTCLGARLAKAESCIAVEKLLDGFPTFTIVPEGTRPPQGFEFRKPASLTLARPGQAKAAFVQTSHHMSMGDKA